MTKYSNLQNIIKPYGKVAVAFSGGVDSTLLLKAAVDTLGANNVIAITAVSRFFPAREKNEAEAFAASLGVKQLFAYEDEMNIPGVPENGPDRCYHCKHALFTAMRDMAAAEGFDTLAEGTNLDDEADYRPGMRALSELDIESPLRKAGLYKSDIRALSKDLGLPTWQKPAFACLASRVPYGEPLTIEKLARIEKAEDKLNDLGFGNVRVRDHHDGEIARIEVEPEALAKLHDPQIAAEVDEYLKSIGYTYVAAELTGYRMGNLNRALDIESEIL